MFKLSFKQQVLTGFAISLLFVLISAITSHLSIQKLDEATKWQGHTYDVINLTKDIETYMLTAESSIRGFVLSTDRQHLAPYNENASKIAPAIIQLKNTVSDNPEQLSRIDSLSVNAHAKVGDMQEVLRIYEREGQGAAAKHVMKGNGQYYKNQILRTTSDIIKVESKLLAQRKAKVSQSSLQSEAIVLLSAVVIFCLILFLFSYIKRTFDQQKQTEVEILNTNLQLERISADNEQKNWLLSGATGINEAMRGEQEVEELSANIITQICTYINAAVGAIYLVDQSKKTITLTAAYAYPKNASRQYRFGEGLVGQTVLEKKCKLLSDIPSDYVKITSGLGSAAPTHIFILPVQFEDQAIAVIELALNQEPGESAILFLNSVTESIGVGLNSALARAELRTLFERTQQQAEELESQQEELRTTNEELLYKSEQLQASEEELRVQQEELRQTNAELEEKAQLLEERNAIVNEAREAISLKAEELELSSKYKSEFLANMSHELRTPLNSILILARILKENRPENLNEDQIKYAGVIHNAGTDLLTLINDILDLSKIESGKIDLTIERLKPGSVKQHMEALFTELARSKKINFKTIADNNLPESILTDQSRLEQIVKNLLSNAFKFTPQHGEITLRISPAKNSTAFFSQQLKATKEKIISISVEDSGIGIPEEKQKLIFEAFQQADGSTSRKYGGTGLGLSISKELAHILGGEIQVKSEINKGSVFTLFIPEKNIFDDDNQVQEEAVDPKKEADSLLETVAMLPAAPENGRAQTLLIIEDDEAFADLLSDYASEKGFKPMLAHSGDTGLEMAFKELPDAIVLDIMLPVMDGWTILKKLKADTRTRHIPVHLMSAGHENANRAQKEGAIGFLMKPMEKEQMEEAFNLLNANHIPYNLNKVLVIEDQELHSKILKEQLTERGVHVKQAFTGKEAVELLKEHTFDCIILDLKLPDISGFDLLDIIKSQPSLTHVPIIINTAMELDDTKMSHIMKYSEAMVLKSTKSNDRLIDEVSLFMNKLKQTGNTTSRITTNTAKSSGISTIEKVFQDKTILIADDDMRNIFALSSALQIYDLNIVIANNGSEALAQLNKNQEIDLVLMDIMMPEMDGYEAMKAIRDQKQFAKLPIIALTAKAMKHDREKCIEAGANDYISKPVDMDKLLSMLRVWLS